MKAANCDHLCQLHFKDIISKIIRSFTQTLYYIIVCMKHCQVVAPVV